MTNRNALSGTELAERLSIEQCLKVWTEAEADIRSAFQELERARAALTHTFSSDSFGFSIPSGRCHHSIATDEVDVVLAKLRRSVWSSLVDRLELRRMMSVKAWEELQRQIDQDDSPEITSETLTGMVKGFTDRLDSMLEEAIVEVFNWLRPRRSQYKTNSEFEIGKRVILKYAVSAIWSGGGFNLVYEKEPNFTALENVFSALDGKGSITKGHYSALSTAIKESPDGSGETEYFRFRCYGNQNLHLEFKRLDLVARLNQVAGGARLRGTRAA
jgi:hypothetical protein